MNYICFEFFFLDVQPYLNGGTPNSSWEMPSMKSAIYVSGPINNASVPGDSTTQFEFMNTGKSSVKSIVTVAFLYLKGCQASRVGE